MTAQSSPGMPPNQQPSATWCFVCGVENPHGLQIRFFSDGAHRALARVTLGDAYQGYPGIAHGGIVAAILDETIGRASLAAAPESDAGDIAEGDAVPWFMVTAKLDIRYRQPVPLNQEFTVRGRIDELRRRSAQASGEIVLADGATAAEASAVLVDIPREQVEAWMQQDVGWRVYP